MGGEWTAAARIGVVAAVEEVRAVAAREDVAAPRTVEAIIAGVAPQHVAAAADRGVVTVSGYRTVTIDRRDTLDRAPRRRCRGDHRFMVDEPRRRRSPPQPRSR